MNIKPIKSEKDYEKALKRVEKLWDSKKTQTEKDEFEVLFTLVEKYEDEHYPILPPDPIEAIKFRMEQMGLIQKDMVTYFGYPSRVSDVLNRRRPLTIEMVKKLHLKLNIPAEVLIQ